MVKKNNAKKTKKSKKFETKHKNKGKAVEELTLLELDQIINEPKINDKKWLEKFIKDSETIKDFLTKIESRNKNLEKEDWITSAFASSKYGKLQILQWILTSKKVPVLVTNDQGSLLHSAILNNHSNIVRWLLDTTRDYTCARALFCQFCSNGYSPLKLAIQNQQQDMISALVGMKFGVDWLKQKLMGILKHCCLTADENIVILLTNVIKSAQIDSLLYLKEDLRIYQEQVSKFDWWPERTNNWNQGDLCLLYSLLCKASKNGSPDIVKWLLLDWEIPVSPPPLFQWKEISVADEASIGFLPIKSWMDLREEFVDSNENDLKIKLNEDEHYRSSSYIFSAGLQAQWDGDSSSLHHVLENMNEFNAKESHKVVHAERKTNIQNHANKEEYLLERNHESRLEVIKIISCRLAFDGPYCIPRIDILVIAGQLQILRWLVTNNFLNLSAQCGESEITSFAFYDTKLTGKNSNGEDCAICICKKWDPIALECGHSFCHPCIKRICNMKHEEFNSSCPPFECPLCQHAAYIPPAMTVADRFVNSLQVDSEWLKLDKTQTIGDILLGFSAGRGSIFILEWLVVTVKLNPRTALFQGENIMHLAAARGHFIICQWLCANSYQDLLMMEDSNGRTPVHAALDCKSDVACLLLSFFEQLQVLPEDWLNYALRSQNPIVCKFAESFTEGQLAASIPQLVETDAALNCIVQALEKSKFFEGQDNSSKVINLIDLTFHHERWDLLRWIYSFKRSDCSDILRLDKNYCDIGHCNAFECLDLCCQNAAKKYGKGSHMLESLIAEMQNIETLRRDIYHCKCPTFRDLIITGGTVKEICETIEHQKGLISTLPTGMTHEFKDSKITLNSICQHGLDVLQLAVSLGHVHIMEWALGEVLEEDFTDCQKFYERIEFSNVKNVETIRFLFSWMEDHSISRETVMTIQNNVRSGNSSRMPTSVLGWFVFRHACALANLEEGISKPQSFLEVIEFLCSLPDFKLRSVDGIPSNIPFPYITVEYIHQVTFEEEMFMADQILKSIQILMAAGLSTSAVDQNNNSFIEKMIWTGNPVYLSTIRWLALEKKINIQFMKFGQKESEENIADGAHLAFLEIKDSQKKMRTRNI